jgi:hypothetical protein
MTLIRPVIDEDLAAEVKTWAGTYSKEAGLPVSFNAAVKILIRRGLDTTIKGDGNDENDTS